MSAVAPIQIAARVDDAERNAVRTGAFFLSKSLSAVRPEKSQPIDLDFVAPTGGLQSVPPADVYIASLLPDLSRPAETQSSVLARWADHFRGLQHKAELIFLCTVFRHVPDRDRSGGPCELLIRIRELNFAAIELSHMLGINVIDIDRALAHFGARTLGTDYLLNGDYAVDVAGQTIASAILAACPDRLVDPALQARASAFLGGPDKIGELHRLSRQWRQRSARTDG